MKKLFAVIGVLALTSLLLAACATPAVAPTPAPEPTTALGFPVTPFAPLQKGKLLICTDFSNPPQAFFDAQGKPAGLDVEFGTEIALRIGLKAEFVKSGSDTLIADLKSEKCDIILSAQEITPETQRQVSMFPYFQTGQSMLAAKGNPQNVAVPTDLCGKKAAAGRGSAEADYLQGTGDYTAAGGLNQECTQAGKPAVDVVLTEKDPDALEQLQAGMVAVFLAPFPVAAYYSVQHPDDFQLVGELLHPVVEGISVACGQADCTNVPLSPLAADVKLGLFSLYLRWHVRRHAAKVERLRRRSGAPLERSTHTPSDRTAGRRSSPLRPACILSARCRSAVCLGRLIA